MALCNYCSESVPMPYTCSLCNEKYCGKHRLPESHECINLNVYQTTEYRRQKLRKDREHQRIKSGASFQDNSGETTTYRSGMFGNMDMWSLDNVFATAFIGGIILGFAAGFYQAIRGLHFPLFFYMVGITAVTFLLIFSIRYGYASNLGGRTEFIIWPLGIAITFLTSILGLAFLVFGFFTNDKMPSNKSAANLSTVTAGAFMGSWALLKYLLFSTFYSTAYQLAIGFYFSANIILFYGVINILPWGLSDGKRLYSYDTQRFWIVVITYIVCFILNFAT